jgi:Flp pilus assembly protein TadG
MLKMNAIRIRIVDRLAIRRLGQAMVFTALALPAFVAAIGLAADVGRLYFEHCKLQIAADSAVLSGARCLPAESSCNAIATASSYATKNGVQASDTVTGPSKGAANTTLTLGISRVVPFSFVSVLGINNATASVTASAQTGLAGTVDNALPLGLQVCEPAIAVCTTPYYVGQALTFAAKKNDGSGSWVSGSGVWSAVDLGYPVNTASICPPPAASCLAAQPGFSNVQSILNQVDDLISQGMALDPAGTATSHTANDPRAVPVPLVDWSMGGAGCNGSCSLNTYGFAEIWLTGGANKGPNASYITAQFIAQSVNGSIDTTGTAQDVGTYAVKLVQ